MSKRIKILKETPTSGCRYIKTKVPWQPDKFIQFSHAQNFVDAIDFKKDERITAIVNGSFILGDMIEAFLTKYQIATKKMTIATLSYSMENVNSLKNLIDSGYIDKLNIICSDYFYNHEKKVIIPYTYYMLDNENGNFQLAVERTHIKVFLFETKLKGSKFVIQGSGNFRTNANLEQFTMEINPQAYDFYDDYFNDIIQRYKTIDTSQTYGKDHWKEIVENIEKEKAKQKKKKPTQQRLVKEYLIDEDIF